MKPHGGPVTIIQGADKSFYVDLFYRETREPFDLTGATQITALFPAATGGSINKTLNGPGGVSIVGAPGAGKILVSPNQGDTPGMPTNTTPDEGGAFQPFQVIVDVGALRSIFLFPTGLNIIPQPY